jgi:hypothetical protein
MSRRVRSIVFRLNDSELGLQALLEESRAGEEPVYDEANDWYDWTRVDAGQLERAEQIVDALERLARTDLERRFPGATVDVECTADATTSLEVEPESAEEAVQAYLDAQLTTLIEQAWASVVNDESGTSGGDAA